MLTSWSIVLVTFSYWSKFHDNITLISGVMTIFIYKRLTWNPEIGYSPVWVVRSIWRLERVRDTKFGTDVTNKKLLNTAFTVFQLLRENQEEVKLFPTTHIRVKGPGPLFILLDTNPKVADFGLPVLYWIITIKESQLESSTELSNFIWSEKKEKINFDLDWGILDKAKPYPRASKKCMLCLTEKYHIIFSTKNLSNKRSELVTKCRHENNFFLANYKDIPPKLLV